MFRAAFPQGAPEVGLAPDDVSSDVISRAAGLHRSGSLHAREARHSERPLPLEDTDEQSFPDPIEINLSDTETIVSDKHEVVGDSCRSPAPTALSAPFVLEIFAGTARVTSCLRRLGLNSSLGVDHARKMPNAPILISDLTSQDGQELCLLWASSDQLLGIHAAPPCGTCSAARQIVLRDSSGSRIPQPVPLRSQDYPDGLPHLRGKDKVRVDAANCLYAFLVKLLTLCHARGLVFCVENPRSSWFWQTSFWRSLVCPTTFTVHQACAYGGQRPKWTALAHNCKHFKKVLRLCPGVSDTHTHLPWGFVRSDAGKTFATAEETAYPPQLAWEIAKAFACEAVDRGWQPPPCTFEMMSQSSDLHALRAITGQQPRASKIPPLVPEHRQVIVLRGPLSVSLPVLPMSRIKVSWTAPAGLEPAGAVVPAESQLLRVSPFRPRGGVRDELAPVAGLLDKHSVEIAWGVPFSPTQFVAEALRVGHPQNLDLVLPGALACVARKLAAEELASIAKMRVECIRHWTARARELAPAEKSLKRNMPDNLRCLLAPKRILLWEEMLKACGYTDLGVVAELKEGTVLTGVVPPTGVFPAAFRPAIVREETLKQFARTARKSILYATRSSGDHSLDEKVYAMTLDEVHSGWLEGPIDVRSLPDDAVISRRFGLQQPNKVRLIDDLSISQLNSTVQASESPRPQSTDVIGALVVQLMRHLPGRSLLGRTYDLKSAYRQLGIHPASRWASYIACYCPKEKTAQVFRLKAVPFGATRAVFSFLRIVQSIWHLATSMLHIPLSVFYDDFVVFSEVGLVTSTNQAFTCL